MDKNRCSYHLTLDDKAKIISLKASGMKIITIASRIGVHRTSIDRFLRGYAEKGELGSPPRSGRPALLSKKDIDRLCLCIKRNRLASLKTLQRLCNLNHVSLRTIRRALRFYSKFKSKFCRKKPFISLKNIKNRIRWCKEHRNWSLDDWKHVVWSDESTFTIRSGRRFQVWVQSGEPLHHQVVKGTVKHDRKINVWGCFSDIAVGTLHRIDGILDKHKFLDIMETVAEPSCRQMFPDDDYMFQQDNDPKHKSKLVQRWMQRNINTIDWWPAQSPDLNPIENLWSILDHRCKDRQCKNEDELFNLLHNEWQSLPAEVLHNLVSSLPRRIEAVLKARGGPTKY